MACRRAIAYSATIQRSLFIKMSSQVLAQGHNLNPQNHSPNPLPLVPQVQALDRKYPNPWDVNRPKFGIGPDVEEIKTFWEHIDSIWAIHPVADNVKKERTLEFVDAIDLKDQWKRIAEFEPNYTYEQWKAAILKFYPEIDELVSGSLDKIQNLCRVTKGLERKALGPFRRFAVAFNSEALKLLTPPAQVTNRDLVQMVLKMLDSNFAKEVELTLNQPLAVAAVELNSELNLSPPSVVIQQAMNAQLNRRGDKFTFVQVLKIIDYLMCNWSGRIAMDSLSLEGSRRAITVNPLSAATVDPLLPTGEVLLSAIAYSVDNDIMREVDDKLNLFAQEIASIKDTIHLLDKKMNEAVKMMSDMVENSFRVFNQSLNSSTQTEVSDAEENDRVDHLYDCRDDELKSYRVQQSME